jgi:hypothetical protein
MIIDSVICVSTSSSTHSTPSISMPCPNEAASVVVGNDNEVAAPNVLILMMTMTNLKLVGRDRRGAHPLFEITLTKK